MDDLVWWAGGGRATLTEESERYRGAHFGLGQKHAGRAVTMGGGKGSSVGFLVEAIKARLAVGCPGNSRCEANHPEIRVS